MSETEMRPGDDLPTWAVDALRRPVRARAGATERIMARVRRAPLPSVTAGPAFFPRWSRRGVLSPVAGAVLAAAFGGVAVLGGGADAPVTFAPTADAEAIVVKDTVVARGDGIGGTLDRLCDTLRIVRFVLREPGAARVTLAGDFNGWRRDATPLVRDARSGAWVARVAVPRTARRYSFVVDGARWMTAPRPVMADSALVGAT